MHVNRKNENIWLDERLFGNEYFHVSMAGETTPNPNYIISHTPETDSGWNRYNFEYVLSGKGYIETKDRVYAVQKGDLYFLNKYQQHIYYADKNDPYDKYFLVVEGKLVDKFLEAHDITESVIVVHKDVADVFRQAFRVISAADKTGDETYNAMTGIVLKLVQAVREPDYRPVPREEHPAKIIKSYIDYNVYEKLTLSDIAKTAHLSVSQTERVFKAKYGISPVKYVIEKKLEAAASLFITSFFNVSEVSTRLGFSDVKYFSRLFKAKFGKPPSEFIKNLQQNPF